MGAQREALMGLRRRVDELAARAELTPVDLVPVERTLAGLDTAMTELAVAVSQDMDGLRSDLNKLRSDLSALSAKVAAPGNSGVGGSKKP